MILPHELLSLHNPDLLTKFKMDYNVYFFNINQLSVIQVNEMDIWTHKILLNPTNEYLFIIGEDISIISIHDCFPREYIKCNNVWYGNFIDNWNIYPLKEIINQCTKCYEYFYKISDVDTCNTCIKWIDNNRKIQDRVKREIGKKYLLFPITNDETTLYRMIIYADKRPIHEVDINLANEIVDWWYPLDTSEYQDNEIVIVVDDLPKKVEGFSKIYVTDEYIENIYDEQLRPQLRFSQQYGWCNDPNGLVYHNNEYHLFYQSNPFGNICENQYWGHAISTDLVHWKQLPLALYPRVMASGHCFSGSANVNNETMIIAFTDTNKGECLAFSTDNGRSWDCKYTPIIKHVGRDPKLIRYQDHWTIVVYEQMSDGDKFGFYNSDDLNKWNFTGYLDNFRECVEMFELCIDHDNNNKKWVIFGFDSMYMIGNFNGEIFVPEHKNKYKLHYGLFQASQCFSLAPNNRVIQIGWIPIDMPNMKFNQAFSLPIELSLKTTKNGVRLHGEPIKELDMLRNECFRITEQILCNDSIVIPTSGQLFDIVIEIEFGDAEIVELLFGDNIVQYNNKTRELDGIVAPLNNEILNLRIIIDRPMYELCFDHGLIYNTKQNNTTGGFQIIKLSVINGKVIIKHFIVYKMNSIW